MTDEQAHTLRESIDTISHGLGVREVGVADLEAGSRQVPDIFERVGASYPRAVVMAMPLNPATLEGVIDAPTPLYFHAYRQLNYRLDVAASRVAEALIEAGYRSLAIAASQIVGRDPPRGHVSHRHVAAAAGIGWTGRSGLLVTPAYGARVRLVSVLTEAPLDAGSPMPFSCGGCVRCAKVCPAHAISASGGRFDLEACYLKLTEFTRIPYVGQHICGVCVKACAPDNPARGIDSSGNPAQVSSDG